MKEFFESMASVERIYWYIALAASLIFVIQTVLTFVGADADTGGEADFDGNLSDGSMPFQLFSFRNLVNFLLGFGWAGASLYNMISNNVVLAIVALIVGSAFIGLFFVVMRSMMKLEEDNSFKSTDAIGKTAEVYTTIPANNTGKGKISISVRGTMHELPAMTSRSESIPTRSVVRVVEIKDDILIVEVVK